MRFEAVDVFAEIDPHLQRWLAQRQERPVALRLAAAGQPAVEDGASAEAEVAVLARVASPQAWRGLPGVAADAVVGRAGGLPGYVVTGRVPVGCLAEVRQSPAVYSLKAARTVAPVLAATTHAIGAVPARLGADNPLGRGVIVGVVDFGLDFAHPNFRNISGGTRLAALWDQRGAAREGSPYGYGRLYSRSEINQALKARDPYAALGYGDRRDDYWRAGTHGTHVTDIAAGNGRGTGTPGVAGAADLVFVDLAASDIPWEGEQVVNASFGDSVQLLEAVTFLFELARKRRKPCVVNLSLGTNGGPHDGSTLLEQGLDSLVSQAPGRAVVLAAGNAYGDGIHATGSVPQGGTRDLEWDVPQHDVSQNELEIWYDGGTELAVELIGPNGRSLGRVALGASARVQDRLGRTTVFVAHRRQDPNNGDNVIGVFLGAAAPAGLWTLRLHGVAVAEGAFHAWIERDDTRPSHFLPPHDNRYTLGSLSTGHKSIVVGAYNAHAAGAAIAPFSGAGPTRDGRQKPELSAPGQSVWAARSLSTQGLVAMSGTSMAAPAVTGVIALLLAEARARGQQLPDVDEIRRRLQETALHEPPPGAWDARYGAGRVWAPGALG